MQGTEGAKAQRSQKSGHVLGLGVVGEGDECGLEGGSNVTGPGLSSSGVGIREPWKGGEQGRELRKGPEA